jgi:hypothetical protein
MNPPWRSDVGSRSTIGVYGVSLIELIGVLAVLAIVAGLLLPRILKPVSHAESGSQAVNLARVDEALMNLEAVRSATAEHCARFRSLASRSETPVPVAGSLDHFDGILLSEGLLDKPFNVRLGSSAQVRLVNISRLSAATPVDARNGAYDLSGHGRNDLAVATYVVEAVLFGVSAAEARALNDRLDGPSLGAKDGESADMDIRGKVVYVPTPPGDKREVHIYIMHQ